MLSFLVWLVLLLLLLLLLMSLLIFFFAAVASVVVVAAACSADVAATVACSAAADVVVAVAAADVDVAAVVAATAASLNLMLHLMMVVNFYENGRIARGGEVCCHGKWMTIAMMTWNILSIPVQGLQWASCLLLTTRRKVYLLRIMFAIPA